MRIATMMSVAVVGLSTAALAQVSTAPSTGYQNNSMSTMNDSMSNDMMTSNDSMSNGMTTEDSMMNNSTTPTKKPKRPR